MKNVFLAATVMALLCSTSLEAATYTNFNHTHTAEHRTSYKITKRRQTYDNGVPNMVRNEAARQGVPASLALAIAKHESGFRCSAVGKRGERGVMQIKPSTARGIGYTGSARGLNDCTTGIYWGMKYLKMALVKAGGDVKRAAFLFNAGLGAKSRNPGKKPYVVAVIRKKALTE
jgi:soluble lytic murein transglycosylase-like protein